MSGTSYSTAIVSGIAALLIERDVRITIDQLEEELFRICQSLENVSQSRQGKGMPCLGKLDLGDKNKSYSESCNLFFQANRRALKNTHLLGVKIIMPHKVSIGESIPVRVCVEIVNSTLNNADLIPESEDYITVEMAPNETELEELIVLLSATGLRFDSDNVFSIPLDFNSFLRERTFYQSENSIDLTALCSGINNITFEIYLNEELEATLEKSLEVTTLRQDAHPVSDTGASPRSVSQPDLTLQIQTHWNEAESAYVFRYSLKGFRNSVLSYPRVTYESQTFSASWLKQARTLLSSFLKADAAFDMRSNLTSYGQYLYQHTFPSELQTVLRDLSCYRITTLFIQTDQNIQFPWSLIHNGHEFLSERFIIGHWFWDLNDISPYEFPVGVTNFVHYTNVAQPETWASLLEPSGASPPSMLTGGTLDDLNFTEAMRGLHLLRLGQSDTGASRQDAPVSLNAAAEEQSLDQRVRPIKLNLRRNRPLVSLGYLRNSEPELTDLSQTWASTFLRAGCSAFVGPLWAVNPVTEAAFISSFYHALWTGDSLGGAFHTARRMARATNPESMDWLAYCLFGDPMARPYRTVPGQGYAVVEPVGQDIADPVAPGSTVRFRVSLRRTPPVWHDERVIEVAEDLSFNDLQVHIVTFGLQVTPAKSINLRRMPSGNYLGWFNLVVPLDIAEESSLVQVYFADGMQAIHTLTFPLTLQQVGSESV